MLNISLLLSVVVLTCVGTTLCPYSILIFKGMLVVLLIFGFCILWDVYLSWMLSDVVVGLSWTILSLSLCIQTKYNSSLLLKEGGTQNKSGTNCTRYKSMTSHLVISIAAIKNDIIGNTVVNYINVIDNWSHVWVGTVRSWRFIPSVSDRHYYSR